MDCVLRSFDVVKDGNVLSHFELFKRGYTREVRSASEVIYTGAYADREYYSCLETNRQIATMIGAEIVEDRR